MIKFYKNNKGQSLIELSVSVGITSMALITILSLITVSIITQRKSSNYYTAVNLAREAIEAARNIRDTNWLLIEQQENAGSVTTKWDDNLHDSLTYSAVLRFDPDNVFPTTQSKYLFDFTEIGSILDSRKIIYKKNLVGNGTIYLDYATVAGCFNDCSETTFKRWVYLKPICDGSYPNRPVSLDNCDKDQITNNFICNNGGACDPNSAPQIGIRVIVEVNWQEGSKSNSLKLVEDLYNWR